VTEFLIVVTIFFVFNLGKIIGCRIALPKIILTNITIKMISISHSRFSCLIYSIQKFKYFFSQNLIISTNENCNIMFIAMFTNNPINIGHSCFPLLISY